MTNTQGETDEQRSHRKISAKKGHKVCQKLCPVRKATNKTDKQTHKSQEARHNRSLSQMLCKRSGFPLFLGCWHLPQLQRND